MSSSHSSYLVGSLAALAIPVVLLLQGSEQLDVPLFYPWDRGDFDSAVVSDDGEWIVFLGTPDTGLEKELFARRADGSNDPVSVSGPGLDITGPYFIAPDASRVVFFHETPLSRHRLYSAPIDGGSPRIHVSSGFGAQDTVIFDEDAVAFSSDSQYIVFLADKNGVRQTFSSLSSGSPAPTPLDPTPTANQGAIEFEVVPGSSEVILRADFNHALNSAYELFRVPITGGVEPVLVHAPLPTSSRVHAFGISPDGSHVVYIANALVLARNDLFSIPLDGSGPETRLNSTAVAGGDVDDFLIFDSSSMVAFRGCQDVAFFEDLYAAPIDGSSSAVRVNGAYTKVKAYAVSANGSWVAFESLIDPNGPSSGPTALHSAPTDASAAPVQLTPPGTEVLTSSFGITADSSYAVFIVRSSLNELLYSAPIDGSGFPLLLNSPPIPSSGGVRSFQLDESGSHVVFRANLTQRYSLYGAAVDGSAPPDLLHPPLSEDATVDGFDVAGPMGTVAFHGAIEAFDISGVFAARSDASGGALQMNSTSVVLYIRADVEDFVQSPDGRWAAYHYGSSVPPHDEGFFAIPLTTDGAAREFTFAHPSLPLCFSPDSQYLFYTARVGPDDVLMRSPLYGNSPPVQISESGNEGIETFSVSNDGSVVVYVSFDFDYQNDDRAFIAPADGSSAPSGGWICNSAMVTPDGQRIVFAPGAGGIRSALADGSSLQVLVPVGQGGWPYQVTSDSAAVVYSSNASGVGRIFSIPVDGSAAAVELNGSLVVGGMVQSQFRLSPDGSLVAYVANQDTLGLDQLFVVPADGSAPATRLSGDPGVGLGVAPQGEYGANCQFTPAGTHVVFVAEENGDGVFQLYSTPTTGASAPVRLNGPLVPGGDIQYGAAGGFKISPDGNFVVYQADQETNQRFELFVAPIDGSAASIRISGGLATDQYIGDSYDFTPDSEHVIFHANLAMDDRYELWVAPLDDSRPPRRANGPLVRGGQVEDDFLLHPNGRWIFYRADERVDQEVGLFRFSLGKIRRSDPPSVFLQR